MRDWLRGKRGALAAFAVITALVAGGLAWVTGAALRTIDKNGIDAVLADMRSRGQHI